MEENNNYFYTSVWNQKNTVYYRGYRNGKYFESTSKLKPYIFVDNNNLEKFPDDGLKTLQNKPVRKIDFENIWEARKFINNYKDVEGYNMYGSTRWMYPWINDKFKGDIVYDPLLIKVGYLDIEVMADGAFEKPETANKEVTAITLRINKVNYVWGLRDFHTDRKDVVYYQFKTEKLMLFDFLDFFQKMRIDVITGWNIETYDLPYLVKRVENVLGIVYTNKLCIWGSPEYRTFKEGFFEKTTVNLPGLNILDYIRLYQKFIKEREESFKLDYIAEKVLGDKKIDYSEYGTLHELYTHDFQKYVEYNIRDAELVNEMEDKLNVLNIIYAIAYICKVNFYETMGTVGKWDALTHNYLLSQKIVVPFEDRDGEEERGIVGGFVKPTQTGKHKWIVTFDVTSLYPSLIRQCNISPETLVGTLNNVTIDSLMNKSTTGGKSFENVMEVLKEKNAGLCASGVVFNNKKEGFYPHLMSKFFKQRKVYKKQSGDAKEKLELIREEINRRKNG